MHIYIRSYVHPTEWTPFPTVVCPLSTTQHHCFVCACAFTSVLINSDTCHSQHATRTHTSTCTRTPATCQHATHTCARTLNACQHTIHMHTSTLATYQHTTYTHIRHMYYIPADSYKMELKFHGLKIPLS